MGGWRDAAQDEEQDAQDEQQEDAQGQGQQQPRRVFPFSQARTASSGIAVGVGMVHRVGLVGAAKTETRQCNLMRGAKGTQVGKDCVAHDTPKLVGVADHCNDMRETSSVRVWSSDHGEHVRTFTNRPVYTKHQTFVLVHFVRTPNHKPRRASDRGATGQISAPTTYTHAYAGP